ncbi:MAG: hypothetical protein ACKN9U_13270 [Pirellulaceae bacterium]|jgi:hypothetical protein
MPLEPSRELVLKKLRHVFPDDRTAAEALTALDGYVGDSPKGQARIQLAILMQCGRDLKRLGQLVKLAHTDFRDVLVGAEYPEEFQASFKTPPDKMAEIRKRDRTQYEAWLLSDGA